MIDVIADAFAAVTESKKYTAYACAVMPDHVHLLGRKHRDSAEQMIGEFQRASAAAVRATRFCDDAHRVWCSSGWKVFQDHPDDVRRTIKYVEDNPVKAKMTGQRWSFVKQYDGWPLHPGHHPNSPYARGVRGP